MCFQFNFLFREWKIGNWKIVLSFLKSFFFFLVLLFLFLGLLEWAGSRESQINLTGWRHNLAAQDHEAQRKRC